MPNKTAYYDLTKPLASEFYDVEVQNENMDKIDAQLKNRAELGEDGKILPEQMPDMDYDLAGTAENKVNTHNENQSAHPYLLEQIQTCMTATQNAQDAADAALEAVSELLYIINVAPTQNGTLTYNGQSQSPSWNSYNPEALTLGGVISGTDAGEYQATFTPKGQYKWSDGTQDPKQVTWRIDRAFMVVPFQSGSLTYTGSLQSPTWTGYDSGKMTLGGDTTGTNAGSYNATFTPGANYKWNDGTTDIKTVPWTIGKAAGSLTLGKSSMTLNASKMSDTITVTRIGNGTISAVSSSDSVATVQVSGDTITVTAKAKGNAIITVSVAADANYAAPANKTCSVTVTLPTSTLEDNDWAMISQVSNSGKGSSYWAVGDTKTITINGEVGNFTFSNLSIAVFIIGFNHNSRWEGTNKIHFQIGKISGRLVGLCDSSHGKMISSTGYFSMNSNGTNSGGWENSQMRTTVLGNGGSPTSPTSNTLMAALPSDLRAVMKSVTKYSDNTGDGSDTASYVTATTDYLFLLAEFEYHGTRSYANSAEQNYQAQYDYYKAGNSKRHYRHNSTAAGAATWCRSVHADYSDIFCLVGTGGTGGYSNAAYSWAMAPGFAV